MINKSCQADIRNNGSFEIQVRLYDKLDPLDRGLNPKRHVVSEPFIRDDKIGGQMRLLPFSGVPHEVEPPIIRLCVAE